MPGEVASASGDRVKRPATDTLPDSQETQAADAVEISAIQERAKKQKMDPGDLQRMIENTASTVVAQMMPKFNECFNAHKQEMQTLMSKQDTKIDTKFASLQNQINCIRSGTSSASSTTASPGGVAVSHSVSHPSPQNIFDRSLPHYPSFVKFQGYCTNWATREGALKSAAADVWIDDFMNCLKKADANLAGKVDMAITKRKGGFHVHNNLHVRLRPNSTTQDEAYLIKHYMDEFAKNIEARTRNPWMAANECYGLVEPAPWRKPHLDRGGRAKACLVKRGIPKTSLKVEYGPPTQIYEMEDDEMLLPEIVKYDSKNGWQLMDAEKLGRLCNMSFEDFKTEMDE